LAWSIIAVVQLVVGGATGVLLARLLPSASAWIAFHVFLILGAAVFGNGYAPFQALVSPGGWAFELGLTTALFVSRRANRSFDADVLLAGFARLRDAGQFRR
jgi:putative Mn2+ efflux pump MntP